MKYQFKPQVFEVERIEIEYDVFYVLQIDGFSQWLSEEDFNAIVDPADLQHFISFNETGWSLQHPLMCRPDLFGCQVNRDVDDLALEWDDCPVDVFGTYRVVVDEDAADVGSKYVFAPLRSA